MCRTGQCYLASQGKYMGKRWKQWQLLLPWAPKSLWMVTAAMRLKDTCSLKKSYDKTRQLIKKRDIILLTNVHIVKAMIFPLVMYRCDSWTINKAENWRIDAFKLVLKKTLESPLDSQEIQPINPKGNQSCIFIGRTDVETEAPILCPTHARSQLIGKDCDARNDWG